VNELPEDKRPILIADARNTYGGTDMSWAHSVDFIVTSSNRCLQVEKFQSQFSKIRAHRDLVL
jgi:hypothetical protein